MYVMEIEENELETEWSGSQTIKVPNSYMDLNAVTYKRKSSKHDGAMLFIGQIR